MSKDTPVQANLAEMLARFLNKQAQAQTDGLAEFEAGAEVTAYEAGPVQPIDAALAWEEAVAALCHLGPSTGGGRHWAPPPHWVSLVAAHEPAVALAFCVGNFPQLVRNFHLIKQQGELAQFLPRARQAAPMTGLIHWGQQVAAQKHVPHMLVAVGVLRLAKNFNEADAYVRAHDAAIPKEWRAAWDNEKAALTWHQGQAETARAQWHALEPSVPVWFNRGMAELFLGDAAAARVSLNEVIRELPEASAWYHLARLYLTLGTMR